MQILFVLQRAAAGLGVSLPLAVVLFLLVVELVVVGLVRRLVRELGYARKYSLLLWGVALNPVCILLVTQHGNFDVLVGLLVLLFAVFLWRSCQTRRSEDWLWACAVLGLGITLKTVPVA